MGKFQACTGQDKKPVDGLKDDPSLIDYFSYILTKANFTAKLSEDSIEVDEKTLVGVIQFDRYRANDIDKVYQNIAEEENKYIYKWVDDNNASPKYDGAEILNSLTRVNVMSLLRISSGKSGPNGSSQITTLENQLERQGPDFNSLFPVSIDVNPQGDFEVFVNPEGLSLYLDSAETEDDAAEKNMFFRFVDKEGKYLPQRTAAIDTKGITFGSETDPVNLVYNADFRYIDALREIVVKEMDNPAIIDATRIENPKKLRQKKGTLYLLFRKGEEADVTTANDTLKGYFINSAAADVAIENANQKAYELPSNYKCCYFRDANSQLNGFLTTINLNEGSRGAGGYAMRAVPASAAKYKWNITAPLAVDKYLAELLGYIMGLKKGAYVPDPNYIPTNWPGDKTGTKNKVTGIQLYAYFKEREPGAPDPRIDFLPGTSIKLDQVSYRKWKKGVQFEGEQTRINPYDRLNAGSKMAEAISFFWTTYQKMVDYSNGKTTFSRLPAFEFTKYVVMKDAAANAQWKKDNPNNPNFLLPQEWCHMVGHGDGGVEDLGNFVSGSKHCNTEQLAIETGLRRVTQSSRIAQAVKNRIKVKVTAYLMPNNGMWLNEKWQRDDLLQKLFDQKPPDKPSSAKKSKVKAPVMAEPTLDKDEYIGKFFNQVAGGPLIEYRLKEGPEFQASYNQLILDIKQAKREQRDSDLKNLMKFRQNLEKNFFLYFPLARWIRYKIYVENIKVFDHNYDAQRQNIDFNECQILDYSVERAIYMGMDQYKGPDGQIIRGKKAEKVNGSDTLTEQKPDDPAAALDYLPSRFYYNLLLDRLMNALSDQDIINQINAILADTSQTFPSQLAQVVKLIPFEAQ